MRSRTIREGSVGLLLLLGIGLFGGLVLWIRGLNLGQRSYSFTVAFDDAGGMQAGAPVRFRGVTVGTIQTVRATPRTAEVDIEIDSEQLVIPREFVFQSNQAGLIGETAVDILPPDSATVASLTAPAPSPTTVVPPSVVPNVSPLSPDCPGSGIICNGDRIQGQLGANFNQLISATVDLAKLIANPELFANVQTLTKNSADAAAGVATLTGEVTTLTRSVREQLKTLSRSANTTTTAVGNAATQFGLTAAQINSLLAENRASLSTTLNNVSAISSDLRRVSTSLSPIINNGEFVRNLETLSANAAAASTSLRNLSNGLGTPENLVLLQQTLDSARATFQNAQKITADLDQLTGDPAFRQGVRNLVLGLSGLVSTTEQLQQQTQTARMLAPAENALRSGKLSTLQTPSTTNLVPDPRYRLRSYRETNPEAPNAPSRDTN
jgi:phospholipid/cholesterol/gamma-HCH transport system substrate-binding protein